MEGMIDMDSQHAAMMMDLHARLLSLKLLPRTGWLQRGVPTATVESIAEHTFSLAALALVVGDAVDGLDRGKVVTLALLHDLAEALVGDMPFSARRLIGAEVKQEAERRGMLVLFDGLPMRDAYLALWDEYTHGTSREARLVKQLDRVEMLSQALAYERAGNHAMEEFWEDVDEGWSSEFPEVLLLVERLIAERHRLHASLAAAWNQSNGTSNGNGNGHAHYAPLLAGHAAGNGNGGGRG